MSQEDSSLSSAVGSVPPPLDCVSACTVGRVVVRLGSPGQVYMIENTGLKIGGRVRVAQPGTFTKDQEEHARLWARPLALADASQWKVADPLVRCAFYPVQSLVMLDPAESLELWEFPNTHMILSESWGTASNMDPPTHRDKVYFYSLILKHLKAKYP